MELFITLLFIAGYIGVTLEHPLKINKTGTALVTGIVLWVVYILFLPTKGAETDPVAFAFFLQENPSIAALPYVQQCVQFVSQQQVLGALGEICETLVFLIGAMTIVEIIDVHGGFGIITNCITTRKKTRLLWVIAFFTFFLSAILDNMTTAIVMIMLVRRMISNQAERWIYASVIIIGANSGGAWSPIGDITTIMLWVKGNITAESIIPALILPSIVSCVVPTLIASRLLHGKIAKDEAVGVSSQNIDKIITKKERISISLLGALCLISVPVFKAVTHLPPFMGILLALGVIWVYTEIVYRRKTDIDEGLKHRVPRVLRRIDIPTILFFLGILLAVSVLQKTGILGSFATVLDHHLHNVYVVNLLIGLLSSIVDNVPLVAASIAMYPLADATTVMASSDPTYLVNFVQNGDFWQFLAYCAGVGGSVLIIGSVAGVVVMGIEKISFGWYLKHISLMALAGYFAGAFVYMIQILIF